MKTETPKEWLSKQYYPDAILRSNGNQILFRASDAMQAYADQQVNKKIDEVITLVTCNDFGLISQMVQAIEKLKIKQP